MTKGDNNYPRFQETPTKVSTNNFKVDIKGISGRLEMSKNIVSG